MLKMQLQKWIDKTKYRIGKVNVSEHLHVGKSTTAKAVKEIEQTIILLKKIIRNVTNEKAGLNSDLD